MQWNGLKLCEHPLQDCAFCQCSFQPGNLCLPLGIVISMAGESFRKGFSVEDSEAALKVLESLLPRTGRQ
jgi:Zn-finger protein